MHAVDVSVSTNAEEAPRAVEGAGGLEREAVNGGSDGFPVNADSGGGDCFVHNRHIRTTGGRSSQLSPRRHASYLSHALANTADFL